MQQSTEIQKQIERLNKQFLHSSDFIAREIAFGPGEQAILCFYSSLVKKSDVESNLHYLRLVRNMPVVPKSNTGQENEKDEQTESNQNSNSNEQTESNQNSNSNEQNQTLINFVNNKANGR